MGLRCTDAFWVALRAQGINGPTIFFNDFGNQESMKRALDTSKVNWRTICR